VTIGCWSWMLKNARFNVSGSSNGPPSSNCPTPVFALPSPWPPWSPRATTRLAWLASLRLILAAMVVPDMRDVVPTGSLTAISTKRIPAPRAASGDGETFFGERVGALFWLSGFGLVVASYSSQNLFLPFAGCVVLCLLLFADQTLHGFHAHFLGLALAWPPLGAWSRQRNLRLFSHRKWRLVLKNERLSAILLAAAVVFWADLFRHHLRVARLPIRRSTACIRWSFAGSENALKAAFCPSAHVGPAGRLRMRCGSAWHT